VPNAALPVPGKGELIVPFFFEGGEIFSFSSKAMHRSLLRWPNRKL